MPVSYLTDLKQLSILAYFSGYDAFPGLPELPAIDREQCKTLLESLGEQGMVRTHGNEASVDLGLGFVLSAMAQPELLIRAGGETYGYCTRDLGVIVSRDSHSQKRYRITPLPTAHELAQRLWEADEACLERCDFFVYRKGSVENMKLTKTDIETMISQIYTEEMAD